MKNVLLRLFSALLIMTVLLSGMAVVNAAAAPEAISYNSRIKIEGALDASYSGKKVALLLLDADAELSSITIDDVKYINECKVNQDGNYSIVFDCPNGFVASDYKLVARVGNENITESVITATAEGTILYELEVTQDLLTGTAVVTVTDPLGENADLTNSEIEFIPLIAFYSSDNRLLDVKIGEKNQRKIELTKPQGTDKVKAFVWKNITNMIPLYNAIEKPNQESLNVLIIGNSFSVDGTHYLNKIAQAAGVTINVGVAQHGGSSIKNHWEERNSADYFNYQKYGNAGSNLNKTSLDYAFAQADWDIVVMQQWSGASMADYESSNDTSWQPYMNNMAKYIKEKCPDAKIGLQMTWAYEKGHGVCWADTADGRAQKQNEMYSAILDNYTQAAADVGALVANDGMTISADGIPVMIIPSGYAVQYAREYEVDGVKKFDTTYDKELYSPTAGSTVAYADTYDVGHGYISAEDAAAGKVRLNRDGFHMSNYGRYLCASVWFETLTGKSVVGNTFRPGEITLDSSGYNTAVFLKFDAVPETDVLLLQQIAHESVQNFKAE